MAEITYQTKAFKSILLKRKFPDSWFWTRYGLNPYNGCQFGCIYCDSRSSKYHLPTDFENNIVVKENVAHLLDQRLSRARTLRPDVVGLGGTTDPYQPAERKYRNSRQLLEVLARHLYPVHVITKSRLVLEDAALLNRIAGDTWANVSITITSTDEKVARFLDSRAPSPKGRFQTLEKLKLEAPNVQAGILAIPIVPVLADAPAQLEDLIKQAVDSGADYMLFGSGPTLRDTQANWFLKHLNEQFPEAMPEYEKLYSFQYKPSEYNGQYGPWNNYHARISGIMLELLDKYKLAARIPRWIPDDFRKVNYRISERLLNNSWYQQHIGKPHKELKWAGLHLQNCTENLLDIASRNELHTLPNATPRTTKLIKHWLSEEFGYNP